MILSTTNLFHWLFSAAILSNFAFSKGTYYILGDNSKLAGTGPDCNKRGSCHGQIFPTLKNSRLTIFHDMRWIICVTIYFKNGQKIKV